MRYVHALVLLIVSGCAHATSPVEPTPPPAPAQVTFTLKGSVSDTAGRPLTGASVTFVDGQRAGITATTDDVGRFSFSGTFTQSAVSLIASKDGYSSETWNFPEHGRPFEGGNWYYPFRLEPLAPSVNLAGEYTLTLTTHKACTKLPDEARTRTYSVSIASQRRRTTFVGTLSDAVIVLAPYSARDVEITVADDFANLWLRFIEQLSDGTYLAIEGGTQTTVGPLGITAPFNAHFVRCRNMPSWAPGEYWWCGREVEGDECASAENQLALVRR
jgi:hypothetical protein